MGKNGPSGLAPLAQLAPPFALFQTGEEIKESRNNLRTECREGRGLARCCFFASVCCLVVAHIAIVPWSYTDHPPTHRPAHVTHRVAFCSPIHPSVITDLVCFLLCFLFLVKTKICRCDTIRLKVQRERKSRQGSKKKKETCCRVNEQNKKRQSAGAKNKSGSLRDEEKKQCKKYKDERKGVRNEKWCKGC